MISDSSFQKARNIRIIAFYYSRLSLYSCSFYLKSVFKTFNCWPYPRPVTKPSLANSMNILTSLIFFASKERNRIKLPLEFSSRSNHDMSFLMIARNVSTLNRVVSRSPLIFTAIVWNIMRHHIYNIYTLTLICFHRSKVKKSSQKW